MIYYVAAMFWFLAGALTVVALAYRSDGKMSTMFGILIIWPAFWFVGIMRLFGWLYKAVLDAAAFI